VWEEGADILPPTLCDRAKLNGAEAPKLHKQTQEKQSQRTHLKIGHYSGGRVRF